MHSTFIGLSLLITILNMHTYSVHCRIHPSAEEIASEYIVKRLFPAHPNLATKLLNVLVKSVEENYQKEQRQLEEQQQMYNEDDEDSEDDVRISEDGESRNVQATNEDISESSIGSSERDSVEGIIRSAGRPRQQQQQRFRLGRRIWRLPAQKRGIGHCIHNCINGSGHMNFIQCKSMCH